MAKKIEKWQAESDARLIAEVEAIKKDPARMRAAAAAAKRLLPDKMAELKGLKQVARKAK